MVDGIGLTCFAINFERDTRPDTVTAPVVFTVAGNPTVADALSWSSEGEDLMM